jgi:hypothetical protein
MMVAAVAIGNDRDGGEGGGGGVLTTAAVGTAVETVVTEAGGLRPVGGYGVRLQMAAGYDGNSCGDL